ncbi:MAG: hypothetical protein AABX51_04470 [Nanoarchaeota archaeon]
MAELLIIPALILGAIIGIIELVFVHQDEAGMGWLGHGLHAIPTMMFFIFASMNVDWVLGLFGTSELKLGGIWVVIAIRAVIAILATLKIGAAAAIAGRVGEKIYHSLIIGCLVAAAPYIWLFALGPLLKPLWPKAMQTGFLRI